MILLEVGLGEKGEAIVHIPNPRTKSTERFAAVRRRSPRRIRLTRNLA